MTDSMFSGKGTSPPAPGRDGARRKAFELFKSKKNRAVAVNQQIETDRAISDAKMARLRALRLAKEESDRVAARIAAEIKAAAPPKRKRPTASKRIETAAPEPDPFKENGD
ncbi:MAG TPA: hypothetical protein VEU47_06750 [Candidatus Cybelea sp.]|nr:hypothetical protein [Candidatus Cybelea sp.]